MKKIRVSCYIISIFCFLFFIIYFFVIPKINHQNTIIVKNYIGMSFEDANKDIIENKLDYEIIYVDSSLNNVVLDQFPHENSIVNSGKRIDLYVGKYKEPSIESFIGLDYKLNEKKIIFEANKYQYSVDYEYNNDIQDDYIYSQYVDKENKRIILYIGSKGKGILMPSFIGFNLQEILDFEERYHLNIVYEYMESLFPKDMVIYQSILANELVYPYSENEIRIIISSGLKK